MHSGERLPRVRMGAWLSAACAQALSGYELYFAMARGVPGTEALDMSKFFDTNYHYLVPELGASVTPKPDFSILLEKVGPLLRPMGARAHVLGWGMPASVSW